MRAWPIRSAPRSTWTASGVLSDAMNGPTSRSTTSSGIGFVECGGDSWPIAHKAHWAAPLGSSHPTTSARTVPAASFTRTTSGCFASTRVTLVRVEPLAIEDHLDAHRVAPARHGHERADGGPFPGGPSRRSDAAPVPRKECAAAAERPDDDRGQTDNPIGMKCGPSSRARHDAAAARPAQPGTRAGRRMTLIARFGDDKVEAGLRKAGPRGAARRPSGGVELRSDARQRDQDQHRLQDPPVRPHPQRGARLLLPCIAPRARTPAASTSR